MSRKLETLYGTDKSGRVKSWEACVESNTDGTATVTVTYGLLEGKKQTTTRVYTTGKNIGRANETSPFEQALAETQSKWKDKREKEGYDTSSPTIITTTTTPVTPTCSGGGGGGGGGGPSSSSPLPTGAIIPPVAQVKLFPMLAHVFEPSKAKAKSRISFPCYLQPKLDGVRCLCYLSADGTTVLAQSRTGSYFESMGHITSELLGPFHQIPDLGRGGNALALDGELYTNSMPFEQLVGLVKKKKFSPEDRQKLQEISYHVYDLVDRRGDAPFQQRFDLLQQIYHAINKPCIQLVQTVLATSLEDFRSFFSSSVSDGYEGVMLRNIQGRYQCNYRSHDLQKYKEFFESEYEIVGYREAEGRDRGTVIWVCRLPGSSMEFSVRPRGTLDMRRKWLEEASSFVGKSLTVIYQELSEQGVPRFPVGKGIREGY
jgi:DNA ligase-1